MVITCDNQICGILGPILMNYVCYLSGPPQWVRFQCNITASGDAFKWHTKMGEISGAILVNWVGYLSGPLKWETFLVQY